MNILSFIVTWDPSYLQLDEDTGKPLSIPTKVLSNTSESVLVQAATSDEVSRLFQGTTPAGNVSRVITHEGRFLWRVHNEPWNTQIEEE